MLATDNKNVKLNKIGGFLTQGWAMADESCPICFYPILTKDGTKMCFSCNLEVKTNPTPKQSECKETSTIIGEKLLQGYSIVDEVCKDCEVPLMRDTNSQTQCVVCSKMFDTFYRESNSKSNVNSKTNSIASQKSSHSSLKDTSSTKSILTSHQPSHLMSQSITSRSLASQSLSSTRSDSVSSAYEQIINKLNANLLKISEKLERDNNTNDIKLLTDSILNISQSINYLR